MIISAGRLCNGERDRFPNSGEEVRLLVIVTDEVEVLVEVIIASG
jgi:hypothetical protein